MTAWPPWLCVVLTDTPRYVCVMYLAPPTNRVRTKRELQPNNDGLAPLHQGIDTFTHYLYRKKVSISTQYRSKSIDTYLYRIKINIIKFFFINIILLMKTYFILLLFNGEYFLVTMKYITK